MIEPVVERIDVVEHAAATTASHSPSTSWNSPARTARPPARPDRRRARRSPRPTSCSTRPPSPPAADLEHAQWRWRQLLEYEGAEVGIEPISLAEIRRRVVRGTGLCVAPAHRHRGRGARDDPPRSAASSSTRSRPSSAATGSRSARASAPIPSRRSSKLMRDGRDLRVLGARGLPRAGRGLPMHRWRMAGARGVAPVARQRPRARARADEARAATRSAERGAARARAISKDRARAGCGTGSRRRSCWRRCTPAAALVDRGPRRLPAPVRPAGDDPPARSSSTAPAPTRDEYVRWATLRGVRARGALTEKRRRGDVAAARRRRAASGRTPTHWSSEGELRRLEVEDGRAPVLVPAERAAGGPVPPAAPALAVRQPRLGPRRSSSASSASGT